MPTKLVVVEPLPSSVTRCWRFDESLQEVVLGLRLLGIPLDPSGIRCSLMRHWSIIFGRIMFVANLAFSVFIIVLPSMSTALQGSAEMTMAKWNSFINQINFTILILFGHAGILRYTAPHWHEVISILHRLEQLDLFTDQDYKKIRLVILKGAAAFVVSVMEGVKNDQIISLVSRLKIILFNFTLDGCCCSDQCTLDRLASISNGFKSNSAYILLLHTSWYISIHRFGVLGFHHVRNHTSK